MKLTKRLLTASIALGLSSQVYAAPQPTTFVHLFEWNWQDVAKECEDYLGPKGYAAVQVSPPNEHIQGNQWWTRYQPVSYQLESRGGNRAEFIDMVNRCKAVDVDIYVDAIINHMAAGGGTGTAGSPYGNKSFPNYGPQDFHSTCAINDYNNRWEVQNCELVSLADLNTSSNYVQETLAGYLNDLTNIGVAGFRFDASKHMSVGDIQGVMSNVNGTPLVFQEVIDQGGEAISSSEYTSTGLVTEFKYSVKLGDTFKNGQLSWLSNFGEGWGFMPSSSAVVFVDNHDNQRGHGGAGANIVTFRDGRLYDLANVFMLAYPYGYPKVMSSYDFHVDDTDVGGPGVSVHNNGNLECFADNWKCEHRWTYISGGVDFRNNTADNWTTTNWWDNGNNQIAFGRGSSGHVAINKENGNLTAALATDMSEGTYCNVLKGELADDGLSCTGETITVNANGTINANVSAWDAFAIHQGAKITGNEGPLERTVIFIQAETLSGQDMFIRGGIDHDYANNILGRNCQTTNVECALPITHNNLKNVTTTPWKNNESYLDWYGSEANQSTEAEGTPLDWTTNVWPVGWGQEKTVANDGFGVEALNIWGLHHWMLDVQMDCSKTVNGKFEVKAFVKNGQGWEGDITQANTPYASSNHVAECGKINKFDFNSNTVEIRNF
jgi:alpha-amylase